MERLYKVLHKSMGVYGVPDTIMDTIMDQLKIVRSGRSMVGSVDSISPEHGEIYVGEIYVGTGDVGALQYK